VHQVKTIALPTFDTLHPDVTGVFIFDNSMNHKKRPPDGLDAKLLNMKDGGKNAPMLKDGWFEAGGIRMVQKMQHAYGVPKGLKTILDERGEPTLGLTKDCATKKEKRPCKTDPPFDCCAINMLSNQPDFQAQASMLEEVFEGTPHVIDLLPKFHPEFNPIENVWGMAKRFCREHCDYTFSGLRAVVPKALESVGLCAIQGFERRCHRYMQAYQFGLPPHLAEFAVKKYSSHRHIPSENIALLMEAEYKMTSK
jgi:hypothetical protein